MQIETWISDDGTSTPIPDTIPTEMQNREIKVSGYAGVANSSYTTGKIEGWAGGKQKFIIQHPFLWGARWAYCNGLWLILICRIRYTSAVSTLLIRNPTLEGNYGVSADSTYWDYTLVSTYFNDRKFARPSFYYEVEDPQNWIVWLDSGGSIPQPHFLSNISFHTSFKTLTPSALGAEVLLSQLSGYTSNPGPDPQLDWWVSGGVVRAVTLTARSQNVSNLFGALGVSYRGDYLDHPKLEDITSKGKKQRTSPYNPDFIEVAIDILNRPCPIKIMVDPTLSQSGEDYFCLDYQDYDGLIDRFNNIEQKLDQLPP